MTPAQRLFWQRLGTRLDGLPETFKEGRYRCPAHNDPKGRRDLSVRYADRRVSF
jgi:hypothetical protein